MNFFDLLPEAFKRLAYGCHQIAQKLHRVGLGFVERHPGGRLIAARHPIADQGGFAEACRSGDQRQTVI